VASEDSANGWGWGPIFHRAVLMGMAGFPFQKPNIQ